MKTNNLKDIKQEPSNEVKVTEVPMWMVCITSMTAILILIVSVVMVLTK